MAFFEGGRIPLVGITPQSLGNTLVRGVSAVAQQQVAAQVGQVFQGAGQSFPAQQGQAVVSALTNNFINVGLNTVLGSDITGTSGVSLTSGQPVLATSLTSSLTSVLAGALNSQLSSALSNAGPFGSVLSSVGSQVIDSLTGQLGGSFGGLTGGLGGGAGALNEAETESGPSRRFPGAGDEPPADYAGGNSYTLGPSGPDVVFSLRPANQGPQTAGQESTANDPKSFTLQSTRQFSNTPNYAAVGYDATQTTKLGNMGAGQESKLNLYEDFSKKAGSITGGSKDFGNQDATPESGDGGGWTFICAPKSISWSLANASSRVDMFGTNNPPLVAGTRGMRDLSISEAVVEGFSRNVTVEGKVQALEKLTEYKLNSSDGFVSVPVYNFWANKKAYGSTANEQGYFIIKDIRVTEDLRDLAGNSTRATVDISLVQVPKYQVNTGRDQASKVTTGARSVLADKTGTTATRATQGAGVKTQANQPGAPKAGPGTPKAPDQARRAARPSGAPLIKDPTTF